ncbi:hypothetical protein [Thalassobellus citreus]|uniref:hypothetical protein n=1 Tax=Thalassobellus citreus TaxID=3367752 RepID=UPI0037AFBB85
MQVQTYTVSKIETFGGLPKIEKCLKSQFKTVTIYERQRLENLIMYLNALYRTPVDSEFDFIMFKPEFQASVKIISSILKEHDCCTLRFLRNLITYNLQFVSGVKLIA